MKKFIEQFRNDSALKIIAIIAIAAFVVFYFTS